MKAKRLQEQKSLPPPPPALAAQYPHLHDRALAYLKGLLLDGGLEPGDLVSTESVAQTLGISRAPTTDAVKRLASEGFLLILPQIGCRVPTPRADEVADFYDLFSRSEGLITRLAAERRTTEEAAEFKRFVHDLEERIARLGTGHDAGPAHRLLNRQRHEMIHGLAKSAIAANIVAGMWDRSDFYLRAAFGAFVPLAEVKVPQSKIARAIIAGDGETAEAVTVKYLSDTGKRAVVRLT